MSTPSTGSTDTQARQGAYRTRILDAAEHEFAGSGYGAAKMTAIARRADLSLATVYKTFAGKAEIWDSLHAERMADLLAAVQASTTSTSPRERVLVGITTVADFLAANPTYLDLSLAAGAGWSAADGAHGAQRTVWTAGIEMITTGVGAAVASGEIVEIRPRIAASLIISSLQAWLADWVRCGRDRPAAVVVAELRAHLERVLAR